MAILTTQALVLKAWKLGETSKIVALYTRDHGKIKVVAKGARDPKSQYRGCLEPLTHLSVIYYDKRTRDLQLLSKASIVRSPVQIIGNIEKTALGLAMAELINRAVEGEETLPPLFDLLSDSLRALNSANGFLEGIVWYFETHFIRLMGYEPVWEACLACKGSLGIEGGIFHPDSGGLFCPRCGGRRGGFAVSGETLEILFWLQRCLLGEVTALNVQPGQKAEIRKMFDLYFRTHIDYRKSLNALNIYYSLEGCA